MLAPEGHRYRYRYVDLQDICVDISVDISTSMPEGGQALVLVPREVGLRPPPLRHHRSTLQTSVSWQPSASTEAGSLWSDIYLSPVQGLTELRVSQNLLNLAKRRHDWRLAAAVPRTDTNPRK